MTTDKKILRVWQSVTSPANWVIPVAYAKDLINLEDEEIIQKETNFKYNMAPKGDQCFNVELPCTLYENKNIRLRGKDLQSGFKIIEN